MRGGQSRRETLEPRPIRFLGSIIFPKDATAGAGRIEVRNDGQVDIPIELPAGYATTEEGLRKEAHGGFSQLGTILDARERGGGIRRG